MAQNPYEYIQRARINPTCSPPLTAELRRSDALERAAQSAAEGTALNAAIKSTGYRAVKSNFLRLSGNVSTLQLLAETTKRYCEQLTDTAFSDIGIYQRSGAIFLLLAEPFQPAVALSQEDAGKRVLALVNEARAVARTCGEKPFQPAPPVTYNTTLARAALTHAADMALNNYFSHDGKDGSTPAQRVQRAGYQFRTTGENLAAGMNTPDRAVAGWLRSPPHCVNLMNPAYTEMGVAYAIHPASEMGVYWAQSFGRPR